MNLHWKIKRRNEPRADAASSQCLLQIEAPIEHEGEPAGCVDAWYIFDENPSSSRTFLELWDLDGETCDLYGNITRDDGRGFREPLPRLLAKAPGILMIDFIALRPAFRGKGLGLEIMRELVRSLADHRVGAVLLDAFPLQRRSWAFDRFDEELRDLPRNGIDEDQGYMMHHFRTWGMQRLPRTRYMIAAPDTLTTERATTWPPAPFLNEGPDDFDHDIGIL